MNKGFIEGTNFITKAGEIKAIHRFFGIAVKVFLSNRDSFICGADQEFFIGVECIRAKDLVGKHFTDEIFVEEVTAYGEIELYDFTVDNPWHMFKILVGDVIIAAHNISVLPGIGGGGGSGIPGGNMYKYIPREASKTLYISKTVAKKKVKQTQDYTVTVQLGGPFEQIGGDDEAVGGGSQKVGTDN